MYMGFFIRILKIIKHYFACRLGKKREREKALSGYQTHRVPGEKI